MPFAVHTASREVGESLARRHPQQRGKCRREHGEAEERPLVVGRLPPEPEDDEQIGRADEDDEPGEHDGLHQQAIDPNRDIVGCADRERDRHERGRADRDGEHRVRASRASALRIAAPAPMATATVTPHAGHWNLGRSVSGAR